MAKVKNVQNVEYIALALLF